MTILKSDILINLLLSVIQGMPDTVGHKKRYFTSKKKKKVYSEISENYNILWQNHIGQGQLGGTFINSGRI